MLNKTSKSLFSHHYLTHRLPDHPEWRQDAGPALAALRRLYQAQKERLPLYNEDQTEEEFILPLLREVLGFAGAYTVEASIRRQGRVQRPDYALFANAAAKQEADHHLGDERAFYARAVAVADAKYWQRQLSQKRTDERDAWRNSNPSFQIVNYLVATGADWGILTNGRLWRLYSRQVSGTATEFYEVDLFDVLEPDPDRPGDPLDHFKRWWLFFRRAAFVPDSQGHSFLERVQQGSAAYARVVGDQLKERVFDQIFPLLAGGFVADMAWHGLDTESQPARRQIQEATLSLLYKLLFLLYGEARGLLPVDHRGYQRQSLTSMTQEMAQLLERQEPLGDTAANFYNRLLALFQLIDRGDRGLGLPRYNGGLFHFDFRDPADRERQAANYFLTRHTIGDRRLAQALDLLARLDGEAVDYAYLGVRHLGAIYEGLLEYRLVVDEAASGTVHLENDKGERKATGSYYTPDYVVKYIVAQTLEPILEDRWLQFDQQMGQLAELRRQLADPRQMAHVKTRRAQLERLEQQARETLLDVKVCDPAMGSGHFLVEVVDYLTTNLITILNDYPDDNPILTWLARIRQEILAVLAEQGIRVDEERLDDTQLLQRVIMKRCIYGVDLNRMAVELAKVSLWLHTFTVGAPLSFLDHHLRWGNSLLGSMARDADREMSQLGDGSQPAFTFMRGPFAGLLQAAGIMQEISLLSDATLDEVEQSESLFAQFDRQARPYKQLLDVYVARHFGVKRADEFLRLYGPDALSVDPAELSLPYREVLAQSRQLFAGMRFFHWDLEFPEVFIDLARADWQENGGFDAVVGNPPYVRQEELRPLKKYFAAQYPNVYAGTADLFVYFFARALQLLAENGRTAYISSNSWLRANYATALRAYLRQHTTIETLIDLGDNRVFEDAPDLAPTIHIVRRQEPEKEHIARAAVFKRSTDMAEFDKRVSDSTFLVSIHDQKDSGWQLESDEFRQVFNKIMMHSDETLGSVTHDQIFFGIKTGLNKAFIIDQVTYDSIIVDDPLVASYIKPVLGGADLRPWYQENQGNWLIALPSGWTFETFGPELEEAEAWSKIVERHRALTEYLLPFAEKARKRQDKGDFWWELRPCAYYSAFDESKIFWPDIAKYPRFSWDDSGLYVTNTGYIVQTQEKWLLAYLMSRCAWFTITQTSTVLGERAGLNRFRLFYQYMQPLPVPVPSKEKQERLAAIASSATEKAQLRYQIQQQTRHRILTDLGTPDGKLNQKLTAWWNLTFTTFRRELKKVFRQDIPVSERDEWEAWFSQRRAQHEQTTQAIIRLETELNQHVYRLFDLTPAEIQIIEASTKYPYGEV
jgi:type I restriction-modification system DNA methylase subunit